MRSIFLSHNIPHSLYNILYISLISIVSSAIGLASAKTLNISALGLQPNTNENATPYLIKALELCKSKNYDSLVFPKGRYDFFPSEKQKEQLYISAHDHQPYRHIGLNLRNFKSFSINGNGSNFVFHGNMLPLSLIDCEDITLCNFSIDFATPYYTQALITQVTPEFCDIQFENKNHTVRDGKVYLLTEIGNMPMDLLMVFNQEKKYIIPNTGDLKKYTKAEQLDNTTVRLYGMDNKLFQEKNVLFMRNGFRPNPGIFSWRCKNMRFNNIDIYWAQGMGTLSQRCENMSFNQVNVRIKPNSKRYFTTIDALHFTACKGKISIENGLYENMMDDALNVHGDYLQIKQIDSNRRKIIVAYKHFQSFGYEAALSGETIQFISRQTMLPLGNRQVHHATRLNDYETELEFQSAIPDDVGAADCIENITWTPQIIYKNNHIRNNRARGILVSSPKATVIENNLFDYCSGSAILLSSDCNSWFLSGACHNLTIRNNKFHNCLTSYYQYCEGIISIYPEIPTIAQQKYHSNIEIHNNTFTANKGQCILFAQSVDGLTFEKNSIQYNRSQANWLPKDSSPFRIQNCNHLNISDQ